MLKELLQAVDPLQLLPAAFEKCGLVPINRQKVLDRIPSIESSESIAQHVDAALLEKLQTRRFGQGQKRPRGKKIPAGQSYTEEQDEPSSGSDQEEEDRSIGEEEDQLSSSQEDDGEEVPVEPVASGSGTGTSTGRSARKRAKPVSSSSDEEEDELPELGPIRKNIGAYVMARYEGEAFLAQISEDQSCVSKNYTRLSYMSLKGKLQYSWGDKKDIMVTLNEDILIEPVVPVPVNSRGMLGLIKKDADAVRRLMVMVYFYFIALNLNKRFLCFHWKAGGIFTGFVAKVNVI